MKYLNRTITIFLWLYKKATSMYQAIDKISLQTKYPPEIPVYSYCRLACPFRKLGRPSCAVLLHSDTKEDIEMPMSNVGVNTSMNVASENERNIGKRVRNISAVLL